MLTLLDSFSLLYAWLLPNFEVSAVFVNCVGESVWRVDLMVEAWVQSLRTRFAADDVFAV